MKLSVKFIIAAVLIAGIAALGVQHGAWAKTSTPGTVPPCATSDHETSEESGETLTTCSATVDYSLPKGASITVAGTDLSGFPPLPGGSQGDTGTGVTITVLDGNGNPVNAHLDVCFPDPGGTGVVYRWISAADWNSMYHTVEPGRWVMFPTYHESGGLTCTFSFYGGSYAIH